MKNVYDITNEFEEKLAQYTGAKYAVTLDNMSNGLFSYIASSADIKYWK